MTFCKSRLFRLRRELEFSFLSFCQQMFSWWSSNQRVTYPSTLYVSVKSIVISKEIEPSTRSMFAIQEVNFCLLLKYIGMLVCIGIGILTCFKHLSKALNWVCCYALTKLTACGVFPTKYCLLYYFRREEDWPLMISREGLKGNLDKNLDYRTHSLGRHRHGYV